MKAASFPSTFLGLPPIWPTKRHLSTLGKSWRRIMIILGVMSLALLSLAPAWAADGGLDPSFNPGLGANFVPTLWDQKGYTDGSNKTIVAGSFTAAGTVLNRGVARLLPDGSPDDSFTSPVPSGWVNNCFLLTPSDPNSKILISGNFTISTAEGDYYGLARLNANGSVDTGFARTFTSGGSISIGVQPGDPIKILVGGYALALNGSSGTTYYLLRLNADGTVDNSFTKRSAPGGYVRSIWADPTDASHPVPTGQVRIFGCFPRFDAPTHLDYMVRIDNTTGETVSGRIGDEVVNGTILYMAFDSNSKAVIVGDFTTPFNGIARLLPGGTTLDPDFNGVGTGANGFVQRVTIDASNKPVLAGNFTKFNGVDCGHFVRLNENGSVDDTFNHAGIGADDRIWTMFKRSGDSRWVIEGAFQKVNNVTRKCIAVLESDGTLNSSQYTNFSIAHTGTGATVYAIQDSPLGLYIGGYFSGAGGKYHSRIARWSYQNGKWDDSFNSLMDGTVKSLRRQESDGKVLVAGNFGTVNGYIPRTGLARLNLDGTLDRTFKPVVVKADGSFADLTMVNVHDDKIIIGGDFNQIADANHAMQPRTGFARLNADGTLDATFNAQITIPGGSNIRVNAGGNMNGLYPMGGYVFYNGAAAGFYTRLTSTGALDPTFGPSGGPAPHVNLFNGEARCGNGDDNGKVMIGGDFTAMIDGTLAPPQVSRIARFTYDGVLDATFAAGTGANNSIYAMENQWPGDKIFICGTFTSYNGVVRNYMARINPDGSLDNSFNPGTGANNPVYAMAYNDYIRKVRIGGAFTSYQGVSRPGIAQIFANGGIITPTLFLLLMN